MIIFKKANELQEYLQKQKVNNRSIGFVPTMGALHEGHLSLVDLSKKNSDLTVVSIFVNPTQFNDPKDYQLYPITIENDCFLLEKSGADILFLPYVNEIYPNGTDINKHFDLGYLENILEGLYRPGHFQGVCQVVKRLLEIVQPDKLYLGQKDFQQVLVIKKLINALNINIHTIVAPIKRESNGLAMSSRNMRLSETERQKAAAIFEALNMIKNDWGKKEMNQLKKDASEYLLKAGFEKIDYIEICNADSLKPIEANATNIKVVALIAAFIGNVRLIDNLILY